jgi:uncharacterized membrane protein
MSFACSIGAKDCAMTTDQWMGTGVFVVIFAFLAFAFMKGDKVKPSGRDPSDHVSTGLNGGP